jgi:hypothetical protein
MPSNDLSAASTGRWVLLSYRVPREPSTPRIAVWRALKRLGVAQLGDGLVALPADARTREHLEWVADQISEAGGEAGIWLAQPAGTTQERHLAARMAAARAEEYRTVRTEAEAALTGEAADRRAIVRRLRGELRRIGRRDYFPPAERDQAHAAVTALAAAVQADERRETEERQDTP